MWDQQNLMLYQQTSDVGPTKSDVGPTKSDGGPTKSGHKTPAVLAELPFDGINKTNVQANSWIIKQILAKGVHGLILCHANKPSEHQPQK